MCAWHDAFADVLARNVGNEIATNTGLKGCANRARAVAEMGCPSSIRMILWFFKAWAELGPPKPCPVKNALQDPGEPRPLC